jgi:hypothetical protein
MSARADTGAGEADRVDAEGADHRLLLADLRPCMYLPMLSGDAIRQGDDRIIFGRSTNASNASIPIAIVYSSAEIVLRRAWIRGRSKDQDLQISADFIGLGPDGRFKKFSIAPGPVFDPDHDLCFHVSYVGEDPRGAIFMGSVLLMHSDPRGNGAGDCQVCAARRHLIVQGTTSEDPK